MRYGMPYMGSKSQIAEDIIRILPAGERLVDLFGGGGAITHCASYSHKWGKYLYNELDPLVCRFFADCVHGAFKGKMPWISREDFKRLKDTDGYIRTVWSFGNNGREYMYSKEIEPWKKALWYARVFNDYTLLEAFGIHTDASKKDIVKHKQEYKECYIRWYLKNVIHSDADFDKLKVTVNGNIKRQKSELQEYLRDSLKQSGLTQSDVDRRLNCQMSGHFFGNSQWQFPTREMYNKMQEFMPLKPYDEVYGYFDLLQSLESLESLESLQSLQSLERLQSLQRLERLQSLESLQRLERLQSLESLQRLEITCKSYTDYEYKAGDVVYCDPPYENTTGYNTDFDSKSFYNWVHTRPYQVFFSSYDIDGFYLVDTIQKRQLLNGQGSGKLKNECIYSNKPYQTVKQLTLEV